MIDFKKARNTMVDCQIRPSDVTLYPIISAMLDIPREEFVPRNLRPVAYAGEAIPLAPGREILPPRTMGKLLDAVNIGPGELVLDIGCGLGYSTALIGRLAEAVIGIEEDADMAAAATKTLSDQSIDNAVVSEAPLAEGDPAHGPYDVIVIEGGIESFPEALIGQLKEGGRVGAIRMSGRVGRMELGIRRGDHIAWRPVFDATAPVLPGFKTRKEFSL
jgi:protein-L-isoaspartate(D-aspartate) O-methyltransferase